MGYNKEYDREWRASETVQQEQYDDMFNQMKDVFRAADKAVFFSHEASVSSELWAPADTTDWNRDREAYEREAGQAWQRRDTE